jgi:hypothetical protein
MDAAGRRPGRRLGPKRVPKPVAGRAFTVVRKARPRARPSDPGRIPITPHGSVKARLSPLARRVAGQADTVGIRPGRKATASLRGRTGRLVVQTHP